MITVKRQKHGIDFYTVWFADRPIEKNGIVAYHQASFPLNNSEEFDTLLSDITGTPEEIKAVFAKNCRYKVNRAQREDVRIRSMDNEQITDEDIDAFLRFFKTFWESKGSVFAGEEEIRRDLKEYRDNGALSFSIATVRGEDAVYHTHIYDGTRARLLHSASLYRLMGEEESDSRNIIGMANRYLHYMDMLHFKDMGLKIYDWGGAGRGEDVINITEFKESFGGVPHKDYDFEEVKGLKAHAFRFIIDMLDDSVLSKIRGKA